MASTRALTPAAAGKPPPVNSRLKPGGRTGRKSFIFTNPSKEELISTHGKDTLARTPMEAIRILEEHGLKPGENPPDMPSLITALMEFALAGPNVSAPHTEVLSALATAMESAHGSQPPGPQGPPPFEEQLRRLEKSGEQCEKQVEKITRFFDETKVTIEGSINELKKYVNQTESTLKSMAHPIPTSPPTPTHPFSYAAAAKNGLSRHQQEVLANSEAKLRQVVLKCEGTNLPDLTLKELVAKANIALSALSELDGYQDTMECLSACSVKNHILVLEMNSRESAEWLRKKDHKVRFTSKFGADFTFLDMSYRTLAEFVPVTLDINIPATISHVERSSGLPADSIRRIAWVKRPDLRKANQRVAHAIISFSTIEAANKAIRSGLNIEGKKVATHRTQPEPTRCYKCQKIGDHFANNCPSDEETCGTCGGHDHKTQGCTTSDPAHRYCVNCKRKGHASWDRDCESFAVAREKLLNRNKEANLTYFPSPDNPATWPDTPVTPPPAHLPNRSRSHTRQPQGPEPYSAETIRMRTAEQARLQQIAKNAALTTTPSSQLAPPIPQAPTRQKKKKNPPVLPSDQQKLDGFLATNNHDSTPPPSPTLEEGYTGYYTPSIDSTEDLISLSL